jgi:hypothetical protein
MNSKSADDSEKSIAFVDTRTCTLIEPVPLVIALKKGALHRIVVLDMYVALVRIAPKAQERLDVLRKFSPLT